MNLELTDEQVTTIEYALCRMRTSTVNTIAADARTMLNEIRRQRTAQTEPDQRQQNARLVTLDRADLDRLVEMAAAGVQRNTGLSNEGREERLALIDRVSDQLRR